MAPWGREAESSAFVVRHIIVPIAGTIKNLRCYVESNSIDGDTTVTVYKDTGHLTEASTAVTLTIGNSLDGVFADEVNTVSVAKGDRISFGIDPGGSSGSIKITSFVMELEVDDNTDRVILGMGDYPVVGGGTWYVNIFGDEAESTEAQRKMPSPLALTIKSMHMYVHNNDSDGVTVITVRDGDGDTLLTDSIPASTTGEFETTTEEDTVVQGTALSIEIDRTASTSGTTRPINFSFIGEVT